MTRDELYFDRVHPIIPILQKYRYFTWAKHTTGNKHRKCLQYAMWTMAMALSTQFDSMREKIYIETRQMLESLDLQENSMRDAHIEHAQAWILITCYEFLRTKYRRGWISAGRVFRLIQLLRLHEVGNPPNCTAQFNAAPSEDWVTAEEARRTFWVAYCLDRFVSIRNGWPLTLNEEMVSKTVIKHYVVSCNLPPTVIRSVHVSPLWKLISSAADQARFFSFQKRLPPMVISCSHHWPSAPSLSQYAGAPYPTSRSLRSSNSTGIRHKTSGFGMNG